MGRDYRAILKEKVKDFYQDKPRFVQDFEFPPVDVIDTPGIKWKRNQFGIVKDEHGWHLSTDFVDLHEPILEREALLLGFPSKARKSKTIIHLCTWVAYSRIKVGTHQHAFWNAWLGKLAGKKDTFLYWTPQVLLNMFSRLSDIEPLLLWEYFLLLARYNTRIFQKRLNFSLTFDWLYNKIITFADIPPVHEMEFLFAATRLFQDLRSFPHRHDIISSVSGKAWFTKQPLSKTYLKRLFSQISSKLMYCYWHNSGLVDIVFVSVFYVHGKSKDFQYWNGPLLLPGIYLRNVQYQGSLVPDSHSTLQCGHVTFTVPRPHLDDFLRYIDMLNTTGFFTELEYYIHDGFEACINFNQYLPSKGRERILFNATRNEDELVVSASVDYRSRFHESRAFLENLSFRDFHAFRRFVDRLLSSFMIGPGRYGSFIGRISRVAGVRPETVQAWIRQYALESDFLVPNIRIFYYVFPDIPMGTPFIAITDRLSKRTSDELSRPFFTWLSSNVHGIGKIGDKTMWNFNVPKAGLIPAYRHVKSVVPDAKCALLFSRNFLQGYFTAIPWFDYETRRYIDLAPMFEDFSRSAEELDAGLISTQDFEESCVNKWDEKFREWKAS